MVGLAEAWRRCREAPSNAHEWELLLRPLLPKLLPVICRILHRYQGRATEADDLVQEVCLKIYEQTWSPGPQPSDDRLLEAYFKVIAANTARDWVRSKMAAKRDSKASVPLEDDIELLRRTVAADSCVERQVLFTQVDALLEASDRDRAIFWLYYRRGFTAAEIAAIPAIKLTTKGVESLLHRLTESLRSKVK